MFLEARAHMRRFVPMGMTRGAISGFILMIVSAVGTWAVYGRPPNSLATPSDKTSPKRRRHAAFSAPNSTARYCIQQRLHSQLLILAPGRGLNPRGAELFHTGPFRDFAYDQSRMLSFIWIGL